MFYQTPLIVAAALQLATAATIPAQNLAPRQDSKGGQFIIRTDLKQDNDYNREEGGQPCAGKYTYCTLPYLPMPSFQGPHSHLTDLTNTPLVVKTTGSSTVFVPYTERSSATKSTGAVSESYAKPAGIALAGGQYLNLLTAATTEFGVKVHKVSISSSNKASQGTFTTVPSANGTIIEVDSSSAKPAWDSWLLCDSDGDGKALALYWLAIEGNSITVPQTNKCSAVRLYAEPVDEVFQPDESFLNDCKGKQ